MTNRNLGLLLLSLALTQACTRTPPGDDKDDTETTVDSEPPDDSETSIDTELPDDSARIIRRTAEKQLLATAAQLMVRPV